LTCLFIFAARRSRPFARRRLSTFLPPRDFMRARNPCVRTLRRFLGWYVRFGIYFFPENYEFIIRFCDRGLYRTGIGRSTGSASGGAQKRMQWMALAGRAGSLLVCIQALYLGT
jgi:hypothetical protein